MTAKFRFRQFLLDACTHHETLLVQFKRMLSELDSILMKDSVAQAVIKMSFEEMSLPLDQEKVLSHIRRLGVISRPDLTTRFARSFSAKLMYGPDGIVKNLIYKGLVQEVCDQSGHRPKTFYKAVVIEGDTSLELIPPTDSFEKDITGELRPAVLSPEEKAMDDSVKQFRPLDLSSVPDMIEEAIVQTGWVCCSCDSQMGVFPDEVVPRCYSCDSKDLAPLY